MQNFREWYTFFGGGYYNILGFLGPYIGQDSHKIIILNHFWSVSPSLSLDNFQISQSHRVSVPKMLGLHNSDISQSQDVSASINLICLSLAISVISNNGIHIDSCYSVNLFCHNLVSLILWGYIFFF